MFTGLIQQTGTVLGIERGEGTHRISIHAPGLAAQLHRGDSVAVSGVCLTALAIAPEGNPDRFEADLAEETVRRISLAQLSPGTLVNLELPTPAGTPLGGHVVQGHVDGVGRLLALTAVAPGNDASDWWMEIQVPESIRPYIVEKGSIAIEGISLTVARWDGARSEDARLGVAVIPHTWANTNLRAHRPGDLLNLEADVLLKYAAQTSAIQTSATQTSANQTSSDLTLAYLISNGY